MGLGHAVQTAVHVVSAAGDGHPLLEEGRAHGNFSWLQVDSKSKGLKQGHRQKHFLMIAPALLPAWPGHFSLIEMFTCPVRCQVVQLYHSVPSLAIASWLL